MKRVAVAAMLFVLLSSVTPAQQDEEVPPEIDETIKTLADVVVTPGRVEESVFDTPATAQRIDREELGRTRVPATFPDALREVPGVMIQKTGPGLGSPFIRGLTGFRTVLLVDGIRINHSAFREGPNQYWATVDPLGLGRLEIVKGPSSVLYGSDAAGGTVAAFTEDLDLGEDGEGLELGGRVYYRFNSAEASHVARASVHGSHDGKFAFRLAATYKAFGDTDAGGRLGRQELSYTDVAADAKLRLVVSNDVELELLVQSVSINDVPRAHSTRDGVSFHGTSVGSDRRRQFDQDRDLVLLTAYLDGGSFYDEAWIKLAYQSQDEEQDRIRSNGRRDESGFDLDTVALVSQFVTDTDGAGTLVYGIDVYLDLVDSYFRRTQGGTVTRFEQGPVGDDAYYLTVGAFVEDRLELADWGKLVLGVRYSHAETQADEVIDPVTGVLGEVDGHFDVAAASVRFLASVTDELNVFASVGSGFRTPNLSDLTRFDSARSNEIEVPAPGLDPELFLGFEVGVKYQCDCFRAEAAYFHTLLFDTIVRTPTGQVIDGEIVVTKDNVGDGFVQGFEVAAEWEPIEDVFVRGQFSWTEGEVDTFPTSARVKEREPLSRLPPIYARFSVAWNPDDCGFWVEASTEIAGEADRLNTRDKGDTQRIPPGGTPGYTIYNLRMGYDFDDDLSVFLHFENLTDKSYRIHGSGSQEPGFSAVAGFEYRF